MEKLRYGNSHIAGERIEVRRPSFVQCLCSTYPQEKQGVLSLSAGKMTADSGGHHLTSMPINFFPKAGMVLMCDFKGYIAPEIVKARQVVIIGPTHMKRPGLVAVVPLSTTPPNPVEPYHYRLPTNPVKGDPANEVWAKCDLVASVSLVRLDRIKQGRGVYVTGNVTTADLLAIRLAVGKSIGLEI